MKNNTIYPENGSVVIIDDQINEALPLIRTLSKHNISYKYFTGEIEDLPEQPLSNVKIVFLDIQLTGMEGVTNDKTKLSALANIISKIVGNSCLPYIIIAWTKHNEIVPDLTAYLKNNKPLFILAIGKDEVKENDEYNVSKIEEKLKGEINKSRAFQFFLKWQNIVNVSSHKVVNEIASIYPFNENWDKNTGNIFKMLAEAHAGKQAENDIIKYSMLCFNNLYLDIIENRILSDNLDLKFNPGEINNLNEDEIKGELNKRLLISNTNDTKVIPGNLYESIDINIIGNEIIIKEMFSGDLDRFENRENILNTSQLIFLEVSPFCDYAQNKWKMHRILPGISWPFEYERYLKKADYIYKTPLFRINNKLLFYVFDIRHLTSISFEMLNNKESRMRFRKELLNDIQTKIAAHINRLGVTSV